MICTGLATAAVAAAAVAAKYHTKNQFLSLASIIFAITTAAAAAAARMKHKETIYHPVKPINGVFHSSKLDLVLAF